MIIFTVSIDDHQTSSNASHKYIYPARALRALELLLADGAPTVGRGKTFLTHRPYLYENGRNLETKSRKIDPKVGNEPSLQGLQTTAPVVELYHPAILDGGHFLI